MRSVSVQLACRTGSGGRARATPHPAHLLAPAMKQRAGRSRSVASEIQRGGTCDMQVPSEIPTASPGRARSRTPRRSSRRAPDGSTPGALVEAERREPARSVTPTGWAPPAPGGEGTAAGRSVAPRGARPDRRPARARPAQSSRLAAAEPGAPGDHRGAWRVLRHPVHFRPLYPWAMVPSPGRPSTRAATIVASLPPRSRVPQPWRPAWVPWPCRISTTRMSSTRGPSRSSPDAGVLMGGALR